MCNVPNKKNCKFNNSIKKIQNVKKELIKENIDIFCYLSKNGKIALTKENDVGFLKKFNLPKIEKNTLTKNLKKWKLLKKYKNSISNKKLNINLYYRFSKQIPLSFTWYSIKDSKEFMPTFTKKIFKKVSVLF